MASGRSKQLKSRSTILLETYPNQNGPTNSAKDSGIQITSMKAMILSFWISLTGSFQPQVGENDHRDSMCGAQDIRCGTSGLTVRKPVLFVAQPQAAPADAHHLYARPDDLADSGLSWRQGLLQYNSEAKGNPLGLCPAYQLYRDRTYGTYGRLVDRFGFERVYILSAGWGLIRADFLTPYYDITFSRSAELYKRRGPADRYLDFRMLPDRTEEEVIFFGSKDYLPLFCDLTNALRSRKIVYYNSAHAPQVPGCVPKRFETTTRTNWQYECADAFLNGALSAP